MKLSLDALARELLKDAKGSNNGRTAETVYGGHERTLRQTVMALTSGTSMAEHDSPGEATLLVITGRIRLSSGADDWEGRAGDLIAIPPSRHGLTALEDSAVLLTVATQKA